MAISVTHATVAAGTDSGTGEIHKAEWNAGHVLTQATGKILGRTTAGGGATEEITPGDDLILTGGVLSTNVGFEIALQRSIFLF